MSKMFCVFDVDGNVAVCCERLAVFSFWLLAAWTKSCVKTEIVEALMVHCVAFY